MNPGGAKFTWCHSLGPEANGRFPTAGGVQVLWPPGKELFYFTPDARLTAVEYTTQGPNFTVGKPRLLFGGRSIGSSSGADVNRNDKRWLLPLPVGEPNASPLILITNWTAALKK